MKNYIKLTMLKRPLDDGIKNHIIIAVQDITTLEESSAHDKKIIIYTVNQNAYLVDEPLDTILELMKISQKNYDSERIVTDIAFLESWKKQVKEALEKQELIKKGKLKG
jgi:hypothetical protein